MIESSMYFGIGLLCGALIGLVLIPLVHARAVRLTRRRLEAVLPESMAEVQAEKDLLRAEFAMSTRRLEMRRRGRGLAHRSPATMPGGAGFSNG
jgi:hypothetical protein